MQTDLEANKTLIRRYLELLEQGNVQAAGELVADDAQWWTLGHGNMPKAALLGAWSQIFGPMSKRRTMRPTGMVAEGNRVAAEFEGNFELADGRTLLNHFHVVFTLSNGKIVAAREYMDTALIEKMFGQR